MGKLKKVCVVYNHDRSWVHNDINILKKHFHVSEYFYRRDKKTFDLKEIIKDVDFVFIWFASYHGLRAVKLAKKYGKKIVTVSGGYDVSTIKNYGLASSIKTRWIPKYILKNSDVVLAFSNSSKREIEALTDTDVVIRAMKDVVDKYPGAVLHIVGDGDDMKYTSKLLKFILENKLGFNIRLLGKYPHASALHILNGADVAVVAEQWYSDFGPISLYEATKLGVPVVSGNLGASWEFTDNLVKYND